MSPGERFGFVYEINYLRCIHCDLCVEACPTEAITETKLFEFSFTNRADAIYTKAELVVGDDGLPQQLPWEDWTDLATIAKNSSAWAAARGSRRCSPSCAPRAACCSWRPTTSSRRAAGTRVVCLHGEQIAFGAPAETLTTDVLLRTYGAELVVLAGRRARRGRRAPPPRALMLDWLLDPFPAR